MSQACINCHQPFEIFPEDSHFYEKVSPVVHGQKLLIPSPTHCPTCRMQRRLAFRNMWHLYNRKCDLSGKAIISMYAPDSGYTVYENQEWWSDKWDALSYGREIDWNKSIIMQIHELIKVVPKFATQNSTSENCNYSNMVSQSKNCYLAFGCVESEDCFYGHIIGKCKQSMDIMYTYGSERCYECVDCRDSYNLKFSKDCDNCSDSSFLENCKSCKHCFGCFGLRHKEYHFFNQPCSQEQYEHKLAEFRVISTEKKKVIQSQLAELRKQTPVLYMHCIGNEDCSVDYIYYSKNVHDSYDVTHAEDCRYCTTTKGKDCYDITYARVENELGYEDLFVQGYNILFSRDCVVNNQHLIYCGNCFSCKNCFACVGLRSKEYCILNRQYSKEEYESLLPKLVTLMQQHNEWGEFFPMTLSLFAYNESAANEYFPLTKEQAQAQGLRWKDNNEINQYTGPKVQPPDDITQVSESILKEILTCETCQKNYRIVAQEFAFYQEQNISIPKECFFCRNKRRLLSRNPRKLFHRNCTKCNTALQTTYAPERPEKILCENCYLKETY
ncbi:MAG: hypothetical protein HY817_04250 [Candidatus Abawacabacteria bacterium]|nr:hypothetical protein [Candidatus Abawacabacteria bacterium]